MIPEGFFYESRFFLKKQWKYHTDAGKLILKMCTTGTGAPLDFVHGSGAVNFPFSHLPVVTDTMLRKFSGGREQNLYPQKNRRDQ